MIKIINEVIESYIKVFKSKFFGYILLLAVIFLLILEEKLNLSYVIQMLSLGSITLIIAMFLVIMGAADVLMRYLTGSSSDDSKISYDNIDIKRKVNYYLNNIKDEMVVLIKDNQKSLNDLRELFLERPRDAIEFTEEEKSNLINTIQSRINEDLSKEFLNSIESKYSSAFSNSAQLMILGLNK